VNTDFIAKLLELDFRQAWIFLTDVMRSPATNVTAFALILAAITVVMLVVVLALLLVFMAGGDEEEDEDEYEQADVAQPVLAGVAEPAVLAPLTPEELQRQRVKRYIGGLVWALIFAVVWIIGGGVTREDTVCLSCHVKIIHTARVEEAKSDPHAQTDCVSCHETPNFAASVTTAVPGRAIHFVGGFLRPSYAVGYGTPVANSACRACHEDAVTGTYENRTRGIKVSHAEPLEARALCSDCHAPRPQTGVINRFTVGMDPCLRCHDNQVASAECSYCHTKDVGLAVQTRGDFKAKRHDQEIDCSGCHDQKTCDNCHGMRMPHSAAFKGVGHARPAVEDLWYNGGRLCRRCHTETSRPCSKCHNDMPSHGIDYMPKGHQSANPYSNGCDQCHGDRAWIVGRNYCGVCHERYNRPPTRPQ